MLINDRPVKILILGEARITHTQRWLAHFQNSGWTVRALSFDPIPEGIACESLGSGSWPRALHILMRVARVRSIIRTFRPDITSALFLPDYGWLATLAGARPLIVSAWGSDVLIAPRKSEWSRRRIERVVRHADHLIGDAAILRDGMLALGAADARISIIPLGVEDDLLAIGANRRIGAQHDFTVFHNRRLEPVYRPQTFIAAAAKVSASSPHLRFVMTDEGSLLPAMQKLADLDALTDNLDFQHWMTRGQMLQQLAASDMYVSCSESDGTSVSLLEAMAAGCYPIVSDLPANREWIADGVNGSLFPVGNDQTLAREILAIAGDAPRRENARLRNQDIIGQRARWSQNMSQVEDIIAGLLTKKC